jgi:hypothetical protein
MEGLGVLVMIFLAVGGLWWVLEEVSNMWQGK